MRSILLTIASLMMLCMVYSCSQEQPTIPVDRPLSKNDTVSESKDSIHDWPIEGFDSCCLFHKTLPSFVERYYDITGAVMSKSINDLRLRFKATNTIHWETSCFYALQVAYGDTCYADYEFGPSGMAFQENLRSMKCITLDDYDASHPANSDISEYILCDYGTYGEFVRNGYKAIENDNNYKLGETRHSIKMTDVGLQNTRMLIVDAWNLKFETNPKEKGPHRFRIVIETQHPSQNIKKEVVTEFELDFQ